VPEAAATNPARRWPANSNTPPARRVPAAAIRTKSLVSDSEALSAVLELIVGWESGTTPMFSPSVPDRNDRIEGTVYQVSL
jgi:hypothetical protein